MEHLRADGFWSQHTPYAFKRFRRNRTIVQRASRVKNSINHAEMGAAIGNNPRHRHRVRHVRSEGQHLAAGILAGQKPADHTGLGRAFAAGCQLSPGGLWRQGASTDEGQTGLLAARQKPGQFDGDVAEPATNQINASLPDSARQRSAR